MQPIKIQGVEYSLYIWFWISALLLNMYFKYTLSELMTNFIKNKYKNKAFPYPF